MIREHARALRGGPYRARLIGEESRTIPVGPRIGLMAPLDLSPRPSRLACFPGAAAG